MSDVYTPQATAVSCKPESAVGEHTLRPSTLISDMMAGRGRDGSDTRQASETGQVMGKTGGRPCGYDAVLACDSLVDAQGRAYQLEFEPPSSQRFRVLILSTKDGDPQDGVLADLADGI